MKRKLKWIFAAGVTLFVLLQFASPSPTNPPVTPGRDLLASTTPPPAIAALFRAACYDCHSHETRWPWYSRVAPVSWLIASDVNRGREHLDLSDWPSEFPDRAARRLGKMSEEIEYGEMPLRKYTLIHTDARLTGAQRKELMDWLDQEAARLKLAATNK